jgi:hypothetical protein
MFLANSIMGSKVYLERSSFIHVLALVNRKSFSELSRDLLGATFVIDKMPDAILSDDRRYIIS